jgi:hypothetical protein
MKKRLVAVFTALVISVFAFSLSIASALPTAKEISSALDISSSSIVNAQLKASNSEGYGAAIFNAKDFPAEESNLTKFPFPIRGKTFLVLSSGDAYAANSYKNSQYSEYDYSYNSSYETGSINDLTQLTLTVKVPEGAESFKFDFIFCSEEWPDFYMSEYNDAFVAERDSSNFYIKQIKDEYDYVIRTELVAPNNFALDPKGNPLNINAGYGFDPNNKHPDTGTGYGGCTVPLTASAKITNKEQQTVILSIFDASDSVLDSAVFLDNFRFSNQTNEGIDICGEECETQQPEVKEGGNIKLIFGIIFMIIAFAVIFIYAIFFKKKKEERKK